MLANKFLCVLAITVFLCMKYEAKPQQKRELFNFGSNFPFNFNQFQENMNQLNQNMQNLQTNIEKSNNKIKEDLNLKVSDLALKHPMKESNGYFNTGGCLCKDYKCECCSLIESISKDPTCFEYTYLEKTNELQVKQNNKLLGTTTVITKTNDICYADKSLCIHFYQPQLFLNKSFKGCSDLKVKKGNLKVKIGCFYMNRELHYVDREFISKHEPNKDTVYNFEGHPIEQNDFRVNAMSLGNSIMQSNMGSNTNTFVGSNGQTIMQSNTFIS